jgi:light-regulated signal transduction histidine kinase (bacteriophytochrome)
LRQPLERRVEARTAELAAANQELESFSYSVSHDLRAPLRAIDGFSRIVIEDHAAALPREAIDYLDEVRASTRRMGALIDDLLAFSRLSRLPLDKQPLAVSVLVRACLDELLGRPGAAEARRIELAIAPDLPACHADPALLRQVFLNLLGNALKYSARRDPSRIEVGSLPSAEQPTYFVRDNGVGFDMRYAHKLFGVFQRLHRAEDYEGTGVGLAIVQRVILRHGGRVWAEAELDRGATFFFSLPAPGAPPHA